MGTRRRSLLMLAVVVAAAITIGLAVGGNGETNKKTFEYAVGLWGDLPYSDVQISTGVPQLARGNEQRTARLHGAQRRPEARVG
jgi:hypothetical protein